jgi:hypothetical protein
MNGKPPASVTEVPYTALKPETLRALAHRLKNASPFESRTPRTVALGKTD